MRCEERQRVVLGQQGHHIVDRWRVSTWEVEESKRLRDGRDWVAVEVAVRGLGRVNGLNGRRTEEREQEVCVSPRRRRQSQRANAGRRGRRLRTK